MIQWTFYRPSYIMLSVLWRCHYSNFATLYSLLICRVFIARVPWSVQSGENRPCTLGRATPCTCDRQPGVRGGVFTGRWPDSPLCGVGTQCCGGPLVSSSQTMGIMSWQAKKKGGVVMVMYNFANEGREGALSPPPHPPALPATPGSDAYVECIN